MSVSQLSASPQQAPQEVPAKGTVWRRLHGVLLPLVLDNEHHVVGVQRALGVTAPDPKTGLGAKVRDCCTSASTFILTRCNLHRSLSVSHPSYTHAPLF